MIVWAGVAAFLVGAALAALGTVATRALALRVGMLDMPGRHKGHKMPVPLLGGCAIFVAVAVPSLLAAAVAAIWASQGAPPWVPSWLTVHLAGAARRGPMAAGILAAALWLHLVGLRDDRKALGPLVKLAAQAMAAAFTVFVCDVRVLTALGPVASDILTIVWLVTITNAFNFMDNMDGLSAGVALICSVALAGAAAGTGQVFVAVWLCLLGGALAGFLPFNFHPAKTYMGDAGSLVVGFLLAVMSCLTTYVPATGHDWRFGVFVPVVLMSLPLYDMLSVIFLRLRERRNPMVGDRRHFSHRLLLRGMSVRTAALTIYLCTAATAIAATLLPQVNGTLGAVLVFAQTLLVVLVLAVLEFGERRS